MAMATAPESTFPLLQSHPNPVTSSYNVIGSSSSISPSTPDAALKRSYLELLPINQVIDLCIALDAEVSSSARASIWPEDLPKSIAQLFTSNIMKNASPAPTTTPAVEMQQQPATAPTTQSPALKPIPPIISPVTTSIYNNAIAGPSSNILPAPPSSTILPYPSSLGTNITPYTSSYFSSSKPFANPFTTPYGYGTVTGSDRPTQKRLDPSHPNAHLSPDELPSYEEMIVEALEACGDPEGAPPKALFQWMESQYPLHSNFRPSASQALQKAFKRGRLCKSDSGKYSINQTWEGGATGKRTRRPHVTPSPYARPESSGSGSAGPPSQVPGTGSFQTAWSASSTTTTALGPGSTPTATMPGLDNLAPETWRVLQNMIAEAQKTQGGNGLVIPKVEGVDIPASAIFGTSLESVTQDTGQAGPTHPGQVQPPTQAAGTQLSDRDREALQAQLNMLTAQLADYDESSGEEDDEDEDDEDVNPPPGEDVSAIGQLTHTISASDDYEEEEDDMEIVDVTHGVTA